MAQIIISFLIIINSFFLYGCSKEKEQESLKTESEEAPIELTLPQVPKLPGPHKPTNKDIQTALKNAGFYAGKIDGDIGSLTEKAVKEFQSKNNLKADGKVGPKTWAVLSQYLEQDSNPDRE